MDFIRWFFFLTLAILLIASCNNASAQFYPIATQANPAAVHQSAVESALA